MATDNYTSIPTLFIPGFFVDVDNSRAVRGLVGSTGRIIVFGQMRATGLAAPLAPVPVISPAVANAQFGAGSQLALMLRAMLKANPYAQLTAMPLQDAPGGTAAAGTLTLTGTPTSAGTVFLMINGVPVPVAAPVGISAATLATNIVTAVNAISDLPVTASTAAGSGVVTLTARNAGTWGNTIDVRVNHNAPTESTPAGLTAVVGPMAGGATDPLLANGIAFMGDTSFATWVVPFSDPTSLAALKAELDSRWSGTRMKDGHAYVGLTGTLAQVITAASVHNNQHLTFVPPQNSPTNVALIAAIEATADTAEPDPARPRQTLPLVGVVAPRPADRYRREERNLLLGSKVSTWHVDEDGNCRIERIVTTYNTNAYGDADPSYLDVETLRTLSFLRTSYRARMSQRFPRHKLAGDGNAFDTSQPIATPRIIRNEAIALASEWVAAGLVEDLEQFKTDLQVDIDRADPNRAITLLPPNLVNQLRQLYATIQFRL